jgi:hypothetical protein
MDINSLVINKSFSKIEFIVKSLNKFEKEILVNKLQNKIQNKNENFEKSLNVEYIKTFLVTLFKSNDDILQNEKLMNIISDAKINNKTFKKIKINIKKEGMYKTIIKFYDDLIKITELKYKIDIEYSSTYVFILATYTELDTSIILDNINGVKFMSEQIDTLSSDRNQIVYQSNEFLQKFIDYDESIDNYYIRLTLEKFQDFIKLMNRFYVNENTDVSIMNIFEQLNKYYKYGLNYNGVYTVDNKSYHSNNIIYDLLFETMKLEDDELKTFIVEKIINFLTYVDGESDSFVEYLLTNSFKHEVISYINILNENGFDSSKINAYLKIDNEENNTSITKNAGLLAEFSEDIDVSNVDSHMPGTKLRDELELILMGQKMKFKKFIGDKEIIDKFHSMNIYTLYKLKNLIKNNEIIQMW